MAVTIPSPPAVPPALAADDAAAALHRSRVRMAAFLLGAGATHFLFPRFYEAIVPRWAGNPKVHVIWSGLVELLAGTLLAVPGTRRVGAWLALVLLVVVYPANVQLAIDAGKPKDLESLAVWLRLPLQVPLWRAAWRLTR